VQRPRRSRPDRATPAEPATDADRASQEPGPSDFLAVENWRREPFPQEFPEGAYGAPPVVTESDPERPPR
jgi:hypothetical protein